MWLGNQNVAYILTQGNGVGAAPADWQQIVSRRIFSDVDVATSFDRSVSAYIRSVSSGRADLSGQIFGPITVDPGVDASGNTNWIHAMNLAITATGQSGQLANFKYACVIFPGNPGPLGHAWWGLPIGNFYPGSSIVGCCYVNTPDALGTYVMEHIHMIAAFDDLYGIPDAPGGFDEMACACGVHPSSYTKSQLQWLPKTEIASAAGNATESTFVIQALSETIQPGQFHAIRIDTDDPKVYLLVEARLRLDPYEAGTHGVSSGIPTEGIVVYRIDENSWPPVHLLASGLKSPGDSYVVAIGSVRIEIISMVGTTFHVKVICMDLRKVPLVRELSQRAATELLVEEDLVPEYYPGLTNGAPGAWVFRQDPKFASVVRRGTTVRCELKTGPIP